MEVKSKTQVIIEQVAGYYYRVRVIPAHRDFPNRSFKSKRDAHDYKDKINRALILRGEA